MKIIYTILAVGDLYVIINAIAMGDYSKAGLGLLCLILVLAASVGGK